MKKLSTILWLAAAVPVFGQLIDSNTIILTGGTPFDGTYTNGVPAAVGTTNAVFQIVGGPDYIQWFPTFQWWDIDGLGSYTSTISQFPYTWHGASGPFPVGRYGTKSGWTNWAQPTTNFWSVAGDAVTLQAGGRNRSIPGVSSNQLILVLDTNIVFATPASSGAGFAWQLSGNANWDGSNIYASALFRSGDTNIGSVPIFGVISNVVVGTNWWYWEVIGDTNGLTFDSGQIIANRAPQSGAYQFTH